MKTMKKSFLEIARASYKPRFPVVFEGEVTIKEGDATESVSDRSEIKEIFPTTYGMPLLTLIPGEKKESAPLNVGVILSGGQAPGGHNVISGLFDGLKRLNPENKLYGFLGGPSGLVDHQFMELTAKVVDNYRNTGGFDIIGSGRTKLEEEWQFMKSADGCKKMNISALLIIGGDDSNTNACVLAEYYLQKNIPIQVIGCPKAIDGDLKNELIEIPFGFDTACKVYSELIGNIQRDASSSRKYWHFIRLMGQSTSHITLECALQSHPNICLISEEIEAKNMTLDDVIEYIVKIIVFRSNEGLEYGTVLIPEGLFEFIPVMKRLIAELNEIVAENTDFTELNSDEERREYVKEMLHPENCKVFRSLPKGIANQLILDRDPHGNVQVSPIETEKLLIEMVGKRLAQLKAEGTYKGNFSALHHFFGYEGRCATPTNFDADYTYSLGKTAAILIAEGKTGYIATIAHLTKPSSNWVAGGMPFTRMMNMEQRSGRMKPVIRKAMVRLDGKPFKMLEQYREKWACDMSDFIYPGPIQYFGPTEVCDQPPRTLLLEHEEELTVPQLLVDELV